MKCDVKTLAVFQFIIKEPPSDAVTATGLSLNSAESKGHMSNRESSSFWESTRAFPGDIGLSMVELFFWKKECGEMKFWMVGFGALKWFIVNGAHTMTHTLECADFSQKHIFDEEPTTKDGG